MATNAASEGLILVGTDGSERAQRAVDWAAREAEMRGSRLTILTAWTAQHLADATLWAAGYSGSKLLEEIRAQQVAEATMLVEKAARSVRERFPDIEVRTVVHEGDARDALVEYGKDASLLVVGSRGAGPIASVALGSVAFWLTRHAETPVAIVPSESGAAEAHLQHRGVVVGVSTDPLSAKLVATAAQEAEERQCDLVLAFCAWDGHAAKHRWEAVDEAELDDLGVDVVDRLATAIKKDHPRLEVRRQFARGAADRYLSDLASHHEVLVVGRRSATLLDLLGLGAVGTAVFHDASFVVLVVPLTKADDEELEASGQVCRPARAG